MAYRKFKRSGGRRKKYGGRSIARKALNMARRVKSMVNVEYKLKDVTASTTTSSAGAVVHLSPIAPGTDANERDGISVKATKLFVRGDISMNASAATSAMRIILFIDKQFNGALPTVAQILATASVVSPLNITTTSADRFKILSDKVFTLSNNGTQSRIVKMYKRLSNHIRFDTSGTSPPTGCLDGQICMLHISNEATNVPSFVYYSRLRYVDN